MHVASWLYILCMPPPSLSPLVLEAVCCCSEITSQMTDSYLQFHIFEAEILISTLFSLTCETTVSISVSRSTIHSVCRSQIASYFSICQFPQAICQKVLPAPPPKINHKLQFFPESTATPRLSCFLC